MDEHEGYIDSFSIIARRNIASLTGFWFDCVTSIPWSCIDLHLYLVRAVSSNLHGENTAVNTYSSDVGCMQPEKQRALSFPGMPFPVFQIEVADMHY